MCPPRHQVPAAFGACLPDLVWHLGFHAVVPLLDAAFFPLRALFPEELERKAPDSLQLIQDSVSSSASTQSGIRQATVLQDGPGAPGSPQEPFQGDCKFKTIFITMQRHHLPFSLIFSCE